jgi:tetratricopeptide (TPR) repeat protein
MPRSCRYKQPRRRLNLLVVRLIEFQLSPDYALAYGGRCSAYNFKGNFDQAIADCNQALQLDPGNAAVFHNRGVSYSAKGNLDQAVADFGRAIQLDPSMALAYLGRGNAYKSKGEHSLALADFDNFIRSATSSETSRDHPLSVLNATTRTGLLHCLSSRWRMSVSINPMTRTAAMTPKIGNTMPPITPAFSIQWACLCARKSQLSVAGQVLAEGVKLAGRDLVALDGVVGGVERPHICQKAQGSGGGYLPQPPLRLLA